MHSRTQRPVPAVGSLLLVISVALTQPGCDAFDTSGGGPPPSDFPPDEAPPSPTAAANLNALLQAQHPDGRWVEVGATDDSIQIESTGSGSLEEQGATLVGPDGFLALAIGFSSPSPVAAVCAAFGDPSRAWCVPLTSPSLQTDGDANNGAAFMPIEIPPSFCNDLSSICHDIVCFEFAQTEAGTVSRANINQVAAVCGACDEPSCQSLLTDCSANGECVVDADCPDEGQVCSAGACVLGGALRFTLRWTAFDDFDLHVLTPLGGEISFSNDQADGGVLDRDNTSGGAGSIENVSFAAPPAGPYRYWVHNYSGSVGGDFTLEVYRHGQLVDTQRGTLPAADTESTHYSTSF